MQKCDGYLLRLQSTDIGLTTDARVTAISLLTQSNRPNNDFLLNSAHALHTKLFNYA